MEKLHLEKLGWRGNKSTTEMGYEERAKREQWEWCKLMERECLSFNEHFIAGSRELMKIATSKKEFIENQVKGGENPEMTSETDPGGVQHPFKTFAIASAAYQTLKRHKKEIGKMGRAYKKMVQQSRRLALQKKAGI